MVTRTFPWLAGLDASAADDLWAVTEAHFVDCWQAVVEYTRAHPTHASTFLAIPPADLAQRRDQFCSAMKAAIVEGRWEGLAAFLRDRARVYYAKGMEFDVWSNVAQVMGNAIAPHLIHAFSDDPKRMAAAGQALRLFLSRSAHEMEEEIYEQKKAALAESERRLSTALNSIVDAVLLTDVDGNITLLNPAAEALTAATAADAVGKPCQAVIRLMDESTGQSLDELGGIASRNQRVITLPATTVLVRKDNSTRPIAGTLAPMKREDGVVTGVVKVFRDVSEERLRQGQLEAGAKAVAESEQVLRAFAGRLQQAREEERTRISREIHDELGQRLSSLKMDIGWLTRRAADASRTGEVTKRLAEMSALVDSTVKVVRQLATDLRPGILDLGLVDALEWQAKEFQTRSAITVHTDFAKLTVTPEQATALFRAFQELLTNVARHANANTVTAKLDVDGGDVRLEVRDDGGGIVLEQRFGRSALGLVGIRERAAALGGSFHIERAAAGGTVGTFRIPRTTAPRGPP